MRSRMIAMVVIVAVLQIIGARDGYSARVITAAETFGLPHDLTFMSDSGLPVPPPPGTPCATANEDATACFGTAYDVPSALIDPAFVANGGIVGVNLCDVLSPDCARDGRDPLNTISDQLYLQVGPQNVLAGTNSLLWCWDSDLESSAGEGGPGGVNICQTQITVPSADLFLVQEPPAGFTDLTSLFTGPNGPLAGGGVWMVQAISEPEPASLAILAVSLFGMGAYRRFRK
jgi:hypothetical protein